MTAPRRQQENLNRCTPASSHAADICSLVARWPRAAAINREFVVKRVSAQACEEKRAGEGDEQATTERWRDKRPQCAARSVVVFCACFSLIGQCAASARNVRLIINSLHGFLVSHICEAGDG
ncbi:hypothetical protein [Bradyrhizobium sp. BR 1432]|uniref:hypothetical protein n=1 Tax=Bradyrhizobium sp. BR 1432 TaxID=3447966 RepID=UPI003EE47DB1